MPIRRWRLSEVRDLPRDNEERAARGLLFEGQFHITDVVGRSAGAIPCATNPPADSLPNRSCPGLVFRSRARRGEQEEDAQHGNDEERGPGGCATEEALRRGSGSTVSSGGTSSGGGGIRPGPASMAAERPYPPGG